jgi:hypothetical protein
MSASVIESLVAAARDAHRDSARLILVAGDVDALRTQVLHAAAEQLGRPVLALSRMLARALLDIGPAERARRLADLLDDGMAGAEPPLFLDRLELLFEPSLAIAPLRLLTAAARSRTIVAAWPGPLRDGFLLYARPGHPEFHRISTGGATCFSLEEIQR